jgi:hypothetical protein
MRRNLLIPLLFVVAAGCGGSPAPMAARSGPACVAPGTPGGPPFEASAEALAASFRCHAPAEATMRPTVLLVHGTSLDAQGNFAWNWIPALTARGWPVCTADLPAFGQDDIQAAAEFVVHAIRETARLNGGPVPVIGYSQGGMVPRWALRYWPDTRAHVSELIALAGSNHGTVLANGACNADCPESNWQQSLDSAFITALNASFETLPEIDYTNVYTHFDEIVQPNLDDTGSTSLAGGANVTNVAVQDVCPGHPADHLAMGSYDPVAWALALDALDHDGPADPLRLDLTVCGEPFMPGVDPATFAQDYAAMLAVITQANADSRRTPAEPPLKCYVGA